METKRWSAYRLYTFLLDLPFSFSLRINVEQKPLEVHLEQETNVIYHREHNLKYGISVALPIQSQD